jgi:mannitol-specific phosphotransferase system IIBC component
MSVDKVDWHDTVEDGRCGRAIINPSFPHLPFLKRRNKMSKSIAASEVKTVIFACEAGMGSSLMSVNSLKKKLKAAQITDVNVVHKPVREVPADAQVVVVHKGLAKSAANKAPNAVVIAFNHFLNDPVFETLVKAFVDKTDIVGTDL